jgi:plastocyanin
MRIPTFADWRATVVSMCAGLVVLLGCSNSTTSPRCTGACVTIQDFSFSPAMLSVKVGTTVQWNNNGPSSHTTTSDNAVWDSGALAGPSGGGTYGGAPGGSFQFTFNSPGTYHYHCKLHPPTIAMYAGFTGTITVTQ